MAEHCEVLTESAKETVRSERIDDAIKQASETMLLYQLKPKQLEAVRTFMSERDTFVFLPTQLKITRSDAQLGSLKHFLVFLFVSLNINNMLYSCYP